MAAAFARPARSCGRLALCRPAGVAPRQSIFDSADRKRAMRSALATALAYVWLISGMGSATAERLIASLTNQQVQITSNYTGVELVLFGTIERDAAASELIGPYDIVATVAGPRESLRTRRKQRVL